MSGRTHPESCENLIRVGEVFIDPFDERTRLFVYERVEADVTRDRSDHGARWPGALLIPGTGEAMSQPSMNVLVGPPERDDPTEA
jgi:hypothetical protein